ncbi:MAG TPA: carboxylesterase family protein [Bryobacteraceae bacterium]|nr:carboxylesterase family protein [Bryobacteraceae bacterium]
MNRPLFLLLSSCCAATVLLAAISDPVKIDSGSVSGVPGKDPSVRVFKGIPYAAPPVGELRWRAPQPAAKWDGVRAADQFGPTCSSGAGGFGGGRGKGGQKANPGQAPKQAPNQAKGSPLGTGPAASEDCLYLNVWTPAKSANERLPVIVWSYGGGFTGGSGSLPGYDGEALAKKGVVFVTYNYRLGVFGFFAHPDLTAESSHHASGNYGMQDFLAALKWVQRNIAAFGGDPKKVTIDGESAGAILVSAAVGSPEGKGLFHRAVAQSGAWMGLSIAKMRTLAEAEAQGKTAAGAHTIAELRSMSTQEIGQNVRGVQAGIVVDGWLVPEDESATYAKSKQNDVDILVGSNHDEGTFFGSGNVTVEQVKTRVAREFANLAAEFFQLYPAGSDAEAGASGLARARDEVGWHMRTWAELQAKRGRKAYLYYFTHVPLGADGRPSARGATHTAELPYMFDNPPQNGSWTDADQKLADAMSSYWANFAATGDPNGKGLPAWPAYDVKKNDGKAMVFGDGVEFGPQIDVKRLAFFDKVYAAALKQ